MPAGSHCISSLPDHCPIQELHPHADSETEEAVASTKSLPELQTLRSISALKEAGPRNLCLGLCQGTEV